METQDPWVILVNFPTVMDGANIFTYRESHQGATLEWTNRVDSAGSRIEWRITTDPEGWHCRWGQVHNQGVFLGSKACGSPAEEKALLTQLRKQAFGVGQIDASEHFNGDAAIKTMAA